MAGNDAVAVSLFAPPRITADASGQPGARLLAEMLYADPAPPGVIAATVTPEQRSGIVG